MGDVGIQGRVLNYVLWHTILASCSGFHLLMSAYHVFQMSKTLFSRVYYSQYKTVCSAMDHKVWSK